MDNGHHEISDVSLISATLAGDDGAFTLLVSRHKGRVFRLAARFARDSDDLEDICQEVFIKTYENLKSFRHDAPFEHWLMRITVRTCHDSFRNKRHTYRHTSLDEHALQVRDIEDESRREAKQARDALALALAQLKPDERVVITLMELEEYSVKEISAMTGWSAANVKVRAHRARAALKKVLEKSYEY